MPTTYEFPGLFDEARQVLDHVLREYHPKLANAKVTVGILYARSEDGPALKRGGYAAAALVRVSSLWKRAYGLPDATIDIDAEFWEKAEPETRVALLDHECCHLDLVTLPNSDRPKRDDLGRPRLKLIDGDLNAGDAFSEVIRRHGQAAVEYMNYRRAFAFAKVHLPDDPLVVDPAEVAG